MGFFEKKVHSLPATKRANPTVEEACRNFYITPVGFELENMRFELRRMAIALVGIPNKDHSSATFADKYLWGDNMQPRRTGSQMQIPAPKRGDPPLFPDIELDDAVLHFRCGDLINSDHPRYGFMKFSGYSKHISPAARTIGIVTQPFDGVGQQRGRDDDQSTGDRCRLVVALFVKHLQERFPGAKIRIHNDRNETIPLTFARMIMANQTVISISKFGGFAGVATFGTAYIRKPDFHEAPNLWLLYPRIESITENVFLIEEPRLMASQCKDMWGKTGVAVLEWFMNDTVLYR